MANCCSMQTDLWRSIVRQHQRRPGDTCTLDQTSREARRADQMRPVHSNGEVV